MSKSTQILFLALLGNLGTLIKANDDVLIVAVWHIVLSLLCLISILKTE